MRVLVIPEDPRWDGHILTPLTKALLADAGRPKAKVKLLESQRLHGYDQAVKSIRGNLAERYKHYDLWLFLPDADRASADAMTRLEADLHARDISLLCCPAQPEVEIYACGDPRQPGGGREQMIGRSLQNLARLFRLCPETKRLRDRIAEHIDG